MHVILAIGHTPQSTYKERSVKCLTVNEIVLKALDHEIYLSSFFWRTCLTLTCVWEYQECLWRQYCGSGCLSRSFSSRIQSGDSTAWQTDPALLPPSPGICLLFSSSSWRTGTFPSSQHSVQRNRWLVPSSFDYPGQRQYQNYQTTNSKIVFMKWGRFWDELMAGTLSVPKDNLLMQLGLFLDGISRERTNAGPWRPRQVNMYVLCLFFSRSIYTMWGIAATLLSIIAQRWVYIRFKGAETTFINRPATKRGDWNEPRNPTIRIRRRYEN